MKKRELTFDIPNKTLTIDGKPMKLEPSFRDATIDDEKSEEPVVNLRYQLGDESIFETEFDKIRETYGETISDELNISGNIVLKDSKEASDNALKAGNYISFYGNINPRVDRYN